MAVVMWASLLDAHSVPYVTRGPNTRRGEISVKCPWCGDDDPSEHLGISLTSNNWGCLRNAEHRGRSSAKLIAALLGVPWSQAKLLEKQYGRVDPDSFLAPIDRTPNWWWSTEVAIQQVPLHFPDEFQSVWNPVSRFWQYLKERGFNNVDKLRLDYNLMYATTGRFKDRIIIPVYDDNILIGWTGRAIAQTKLAPRYLTSGPAVKKAVLNQPKLTGGDLLFITEGPFDALKMDYYGRPHGAHATCLFGASISEDQAAILNKLGPMYRRLILLFDPDAGAQAYQVSEWLPRNLILGTLPDGVKDPGEMSKEQVKEVIDVCNAS